MARALRRLVPALWVVLSGVAFGQGTPLQLNVPVKQAIKPGETYDYVVSARANQALEVVADQHGIDVVLTISTPTGQRLMEVDGPTGAEGSESARLRLLEAGDYRVRVSAFDPAAKPGSYTITLAVVRDMTREELDALRSERDIESMEARWAPAVAGSDLPTLKSMLREDAVKLGATPAETRTQTEIVAGWERLAKRRAEQGIVEKHEIKDLVVRAMGNTAMSTARYITSRTSRSHAEPASFSGQFIHIWARDERGWKLVGDYTFPFGRLPRANVGQTVVAASSLDAYAGSYQAAGQGIVFTVTAQGGQLHGKWKVADGPESDAAPLTPIDDATFVGLDGAEFTFVRNAAGQVKQIVILGDGPAVRASRQP